MPRLFNVGLILKMLLFLQCYCKTPMYMYLVCFHQTFLTHYHTIPHFDALNMYICGKHCETGEIACNEQFLFFFTQCFLPYMSLIFHFKCTSLQCCLQFVSILTNLKFCCLVMGKEHSYSLDFSNLECSQLKRIQNFVVWERVNIVSKDNFYMNQKLRF